MAEPSEKRELTITRTFDAPRNLVWRAWTDRNIVQKWWGPKGVTNPTCEWDPRPKGRINIVMQAGKEMGDFAGQRWPMDGKFIEVTPETRLVFTSRAIDERQEALVENMVTVELEERAGKTFMKLHIVVTKADAGRAKMMLEGMEMGWNSQSDKLVEEVHRMRG
ncbi:MAG: SRPBCC domain-containing protein [Candidatus Micrarchaeota archaeon]|nr:SRPBCC domain-containing protein [Candidatus Micrarchaeota archaeon]